MNRYIISLKSFVIAVFSLCLASCTASNEETQKVVGFTIHTIGDSTMADKAETARPETGWGEFITSHIVDTANVHHINYATNGRSTKSFLAEGRWAKALENIKQGDYVFIQFGHNDQKILDTLRYTNASTMYKENLRLFINESRNLGAMPILLTSIVRRNFNEAGVLVDTHGDYPEAMRQVAAEMNVPLVDAQLLSEKLVLAYGPEASCLLYNHVEAGHVNYPEGKADDTHLNSNGAKKIADIIIAEIKKVDARLDASLK